MRDPRRAAPALARARPEARAGRRPCARSSLRSVQGEREHQPQHEPPKNAAHARGLRRSPALWVERQLVLDRGQAESDKAADMSDASGTRPDARRSARQALEASRARRPTTSGAYRRWISSRARCAFAVPPPAAATPAASARRRDRDPARPSCPPLDRCRSRVRRGSASNPPGSCSAAW